jgi:hypothetical protein
MNLFNYLSAKIEAIDPNIRKRPEVLSYRNLRYAIGLLGVGLPAVLAVWSWFIAKIPVQPSISHYYHTGAHVIFTGLLCAVAAFLATYKGYSRLDDWATNFAGFCCLCVALFPTDVACFPGQSKTSSLVFFEAMDIVHFICAGLFLLTLAFISIFLFTRSDKPKHAMGKEKRQRNKIYILCGLWMFGSVILAALILFNKYGLPLPARWVFIWEASALISFGISWLAKGYAISESDPGDEE